MLLSLGGCVSTRDAVVLVAKEVPRNAKPREIATPVKAHLKDGSAVLFPKGVTIDAAVIRGAGERYDLGRTRRTLVDAVPIGEVAAIEAYESEVRPVATIARSVGAIFGILMIVTMISIAGG